MSTLPPYLELNRTFVEQRSFDPKGLVGSPPSSSSVPWSAILERPVSVIVAPANSGKTRELAEQARKLQKAGQEAVFLPLRHYLEEGKSLKRAVGASRFKHLRQLRKRVGVQLTVFLDSLDEVSEASGEDLARLISDFVKDAEEQWGIAKWVISSRPAVVSDGLGRAIGALFSSEIALDAEEDTSLSAMPISGQARRSVKTTKRDQRKVSLFRMTSLGRRQASAYVRRSLSEYDAAQLLEVARSRGLSGFTTSPGGLDILTRIDLVENPPQSLTEVFERVSQQIQLGRSSDRVLRKLDSRTRELLTDASRTLAAASQLCDTLNIELSRGFTSKQGNVISAQAVVSKDLNELGIERLLSTQIFVDAGFNQVKLYPDELVPFLAAKWLTDRIQSVDQAHRLANYFFWSSTTGECGATKRLLPLLGWLATFNARIREVAMQHDPQVVAFFGDMRNPTVPVGEAVRALELTIDRLANNVDTLGHHQFSVTDENYWQISAPHILPTLKKLYVKYGTPEAAHARWPLLEIARLAKSDTLRSLVLEKNSGRYEEVIENSYEVAYILALQRDDDRRGFAQAMLATSSGSEGMRMNLLEELGWRYFSARDIGAILEALFREPGFGFHAVYPFTNSELLYEASAKQLADLARTLVVRLCRLNQLPQQSSDGEHLELDKLAKILVTVVEHAWGAGVATSPSRKARFLMVAERAVRNYRATSTLQSLGKYALQDDEVRAEFLRLSVKAAGNDKHLLQRLVFGRLSGHLLSRKELAATGSNRLLKMYASLQKAQERASKDEQRRQAKPEPSKAGRGIIGEKAKRQLGDMVEGLRAGTQTSGLLWCAQWLSQSVSRSHYGEIDFASFKRQVGSKVADAVREGYSKMWRKDEPRFEENQPNATYFSTIAGLQALQLEMDDGVDLSDYSDEEVHRAMRFGLFDLNGVPSWYWRLAGSRQAVALPFLVEVIKQASQSPLARSHAEKVMRAIFDMPRDFQRRLGPMAWTYILRTSGVSENLCDSVLRAVLPVADAVPNTAIRETTTAAVRHAFGLPVGGDTDVARENRKRQSFAMTWAAVWIEASPKEFIAFIRAWRKRDPNQAKEFLFQLSVELGESSRRGLSALASTAAGLDALAALYELFMWAVPPDPDEKRHRTLVRRRGRSDQAAWAREGVLPAIASAQNEHAYYCLERLKTAHPASTRQLSLMQYELRERQSHLPPLRPADFTAFEDQLQPKVTSQELFAAAVHNDILNVKYDMEFGEKSLRRFFTKLSFSKPKGVTADEHHIALEDDFQRLIASELHHHARGRYSVHVEPQTAEKNRRDVLCSAGDWNASIELKMSRRWTVENYLDALRHQLVAQYMRSRKATAGYLVIVLQTPNRTWKHPKTGTKIGFKDLLGECQEFCV